MDFAHAPCLKREGIHMKNRNYFFALYVAFIGSALSPLTSVGAEGGWISSGVIEGDHDNIAHETFVDDTDWVEEDDLVQTTQWSGGGYGEGWSSGPRHPYPPAPMRNWMCTAVNRRNIPFQGHGRSRWEAEQNSLRECYAYRSRFCNVVGCRVTY